MTPTETGNACRREISVEVPAEVVQRETVAILAKYQKLARVPGFRKGKVPAGVLRQRYAEEIRTEVVESLVPRYFREEARRQNLQPVSQPQISDLHVHDDGPLHFKATFEVLPEIEVTGYEEVRPERKETEVSDEEVEGWLNNLRDQRATFAAVDDRELQDGDFAQVSFQAVPREGEGQPASVDDTMVEVGGANTLPEFTENLRGARPGEERTFEVTYPADSSDQRLAGKTLSYTVKVKAIKRKEVPELNEDFLKELGDFESIESLRQRVRESLESEKQHAAEHDAKEQILDELLKRNEFPVPEALVEREVDARLDRGLRALAAQGMRTEDMKKMDFGRLRAGQRPAAERAVRASLLLDKVAEAERIEVTDEEIEKEIEAIALQSQQPVESVRARLTEGGGVDRIRARIRSDKTLDFLYRRSA